MTVISEIQTGCDINDEKYIQQFAKQMLKGTLFVGTFHEKRFVASLNTYRHVIKIDDSEDKFIKNLLAVKKRCAEFYLHKPWIGITEPQTIGAPAGYNVWVTLDTEVFGTYWYKIKTVQFLGKEICLKLETVRPFQHDQTPTRVHEGESAEKIVENIKIATQENFRKLLQLGFNNLTLENFKHTLIFTFILLSTLATFSVHTIQYILEYSLKLLNEISKLVTSITPIVNAFIQMCTQIVGGFYILIAHIWRDKKQPQYNSHTAIQYKRSPKMVGYGPYS